MKIVIILFALFISFQSLASEKGLSFQSEDDFISLVDQIFEDQFDLIVKGAKERRPGIDLYHAYEYDWEIFVNSNCEPVSRSLREVLENNGISSNVLLVGLNHLGKPTHALIVADVIINNEVKKFVIDPTYRQFDNSLFSEIITNLAEKNNISKNQIQMKEIDLPIPLIFVSELSKAKENQLKIRKTLYDEYGELVFSNTWMFKNSSEQLNQFLNKQYYQYDLRIKALQTL